MIFIVSLDINMASIDHVHPILSLDLISFVPRAIYTVRCVSTFELGRVLYTVDHDHWTKVSPTDPRTFVSYHFEVKRHLFEDRESMEEHTRTRKSSEDLVDTPG